MGCTSLLASYGHESTKQITEAYNDAGAYGIVTRSMLRHQSGALGGLDASELGKVAMRHLHIRQVSAVRDGGLNLVHAQDSTSVEFQGTDLYQIIATVREASGKKLANATSQNIMVPLLDLGMQHIADVLSPDCASVMSAQDLKRKFGSRRVKSKHVHALYKLAYLLNEAEPQGICTDKSRLRREVIKANGVRRIAGVHVQALRAAPYEHQLNALKML
jgi:hypothetical protein